MEEEHHVLEDLGELPGEKTIGGDDGVLGAVAAGDGANEGPEGESVVGEGLDCGEGRDRGPLARGKAHQHVIVQEAGGEIPPQAHGETQRVAGLVQNEGSQSR